MPLLAQIDLYCERIHPGIWAEPVNAWSNLGFVVAALLLRSALRRLHSYRPQASAGVRALPAMLGLVGAGSFAFHTFANVLTSLVDQLAILLFGCVFLYLFLQHVVAVSRTPALLASVAFAVVSALMPRWLHDGVLNQSSAYLPYFLGMLSMLTWLWWNRRPTRALFGAGLLTFIAALIARTIDLEVCSRFPIGTHFIWHLLSSLMLYSVALALAQEIAMRRAHG